MSFEIISEFEKSIAKFFGSPYAISVDSCTHGVELCLRHTNADSISVPKHSYLSIPFLADKLK
jgi:dTDP-4-amino-4,6-dideoxygalactose transaminase